MKVSQWKFRMYNAAIAALLGLFATVAPTLDAQVKYGNVRGRVTDTSGAIVAGAEVILTNPGTQIVRSTRTNEAGDYFFTAVDPGTYTVAISSKNFKRVVHQLSLIHI